MRARAAPRRLQAACSTEGTGVFESCERLTARLRQASSFPRTLRGVSEGAGLGVGAAVGTGVRFRDRLRDRLRFSSGALLLAPLYRLYTHRLRSRVRAEPLPHHVAVILDGNRRWAKLVGLRELGAGHRRGADKLGELLGWCADLGIEELTVWALSNENLSRRPAEELAPLVEILSQELEALSKHASRAGSPVRIRVFGRIDALPRLLAEAARRVQAETAGNDGLCLNVALGYSGHDELVDATRALIGSLAARGIPAEKMAELVDAEAITRHLYTADHSDPDLIVRTSGEVRLSGFLPWQSSHSEFYFTDVYWPAFRELDFLRAVRTFQQRERRFGR
jgi:short-chain Z-isoprenyl diphosphate synthase